MATIALIPARGGSKRLPRKNILPLAGHPVLSYPIRTAQQSGVFDAVYVSSEDEEIGAVAMRYGAKWLRRPQQLAEDRSTVTETCLHALEMLPHTDLLCCIYATAVLLEPDDLRHSRTRMVDGADLDFLMGVSAYPYPPVQALRADADGYLSYMWPEWRGIQSQQYPELVVSNGCFYWARAEALRAERTFYGERLRGYLLPESHVSDINTAEDLARAEACMQARTSSHPSD